MKMLRKKLDIYIFLDVLLGQLIFARTQHLNSSTKNCTGCLNDTLLCSNCLCFSPSLHYDFVLFTLGSGALESLLVACLLLHLSHQEFDCFICALLIFYFLLLSVVIYIVLNGLSRCGHKHK